MTNPLKPTVLLIEDDPDQIFMYQSKFELEGYEFVSARKGDEGIDLAKTEKPDISHVTREVVSRSAVEGRQKLFADMCDFYRRVTEALAVEYLRSNGTAAVGNRQTCTL